MAKDFINKNFGEGERKKEKDFINKLINKQEDFINKAIIVKSISFRREHFLLLQDFMEKAKLERTSFASKDGFSELAIRAFTEYMQRHPLPNPQGRLDRIIATNLPQKPSNMCCVPTCRGKAKFRLQLKDFNGKTEMFHVCERHKNWRHSQFRFLISYGEIQR